MMLHHAPALRPMSARVLYTVCLLIGPLLLRSATYSPLDPSVLHGKIEPVGPSSRNTPLVVTEIMYNPAPRSDQRETEFVELYNASEPSGRETQAVLASILDTIEAPTRATAPQPEDN